MAPAAVRRRSALRTVASALAAAAGLRYLGSAFAAGPLAAKGLRGGLTARAAEGEGGFMSKVQDFIKVEQDISLTPEEYQLALEQEMEAERKKYYINGVVKKGNLVVPWKDVDEKELEASARGNLKKNGITDPQGPVELGDDDSDIEAQVVGEQDVRIEWTAGEPGSKVGYIIERKPMGAMSFQEVGSYENQEQGYLLVKEYAGHDYTFESRMVPPGSWTYRVLCRFRSGEITVVDQKDVVVPELSGMDQNVAAALFVGGLVVVAAVSYLADQGPSL